MNPMFQFIKDITGKLNTNGYSSLSSQSDPRQAAFVRNLQRELKSKRVLDIPLDNLNVVVFDIETTGFFPYKGDSILSIGAVKMVGEHVLEEEVFYAPIYSEEGPTEEIERLTGITKQELMNAEPIETVLHNFYKFINSDTLVAHHSSHEKEFMKHVNWKVLKTSFSHRIVDTAFLLQIVEPEEGLVSLDECCSHYGIEIDQRHHALYDAIATAKLWAESVRLIRELGFSNLGDVYTHLAKYK
ncbi:exonuclease domain-containing protein [Radiobacillus sp. PE A8.2]|uniref:exonuclease domain-containing protein n=1 Tax=Radiobacillus sp. PE A8.2 TaxID=3380349 RepID=UPI003890A91C